MPECEFEGDGDIECRGHIYICSECGQWFCDAHKDMLHEGSKCGLCGYEPHAFKPIDSEV